MTATKPRRRHRGASFPVQLAVAALAPLLAVALTSVSLATEASVAVDPTQSTVGWNEDTVVSVVYDGTGVAEGLRGFHLRIEFDDSLVFLAATGGDVSEGSFLSSLGTTAFLLQFPEDGVVIIDSAVLGPTTGGFGIGELATLRFTGRSSGSGTSPVEMAEVELRDTLNSAIPCSEQDGEILLIDTPVAPSSWSRVKALFL